MTITYTSELTDVHSDDLRGFFVGWPKPPSPERFLNVLHGSSHVWLALDGRRVVGFVNAVGDGLMSAYIPLLEVLPEYQGRGIGRELMTRLLESLRDHYMVDLSCDDSMVGFYERLGLRRANVMFRRNYDAPILTGVPRPDSQRGASP